MCDRKRSKNMFEIDDKVKRVAAYCRVSTDKTDQANSLESQQQFFSEYISRNHLWELYDIYVDDGISGTNTKKRAAFNQMIEDAKSGKFDLIITKEISRFARNILDSIGYTRELKSLGIGVIFLNDNINTLDSDAEMRLAFLSTMAQEESRKTSERVKWGLRRQMEKGVVLGKDMLGYDVRDGELIINEEGAETVRLIYHKFLDEGKGAHRIAKELREEGVKTSTRMKDWSYTVILRILRNEKYCGDLIQQKTYTPDYLTHQKKRNYGEIEMVTIKNHHEPIIPRERFDAVQRELERRKPSQSTVKAFANRYALSGKIVCGECGAGFVRRQKKRKDGTMNVKWVCTESQKNGNKHKEKDGTDAGCTTNSINDRDIKEILQTVVADTMQSRTNIINTLLQTVESIVKSVSDNANTAHFQGEISRCEDKKKKLLDMCLNGYIEAKEYRDACDDLSSQITDLEQKLVKEQSNQQMFTDKEKIIADIKEYVNYISAGEEWNDTFYRNIIDRIVVHKGRKMDIHLKLIPEKWQGKILAGTQEIEAYESKKRSCVCSEPISVSKPFSSG
ncbi:MAG: recombinase family protein [Eubacterium sp.]|nr:recombinase family protein [Eubacterium sp.]